MMPALNPFTSALNRKQHTEAERQETSNDTRTASAFTSKRPKRNQTSSITKKKTRPDVCLVGFSISRHSVREAAFKRGAVQSGLKQAMAVHFYSVDCSRLSGYSYAPSVESRGRNAYLGKWPLFCLSDPFQFRILTRRRMRQQKTRPSCTRPGFYTLLP